MPREYLTEGGGDRGGWGRGRILLNANLVIMLFLSAVGIHVFLNDEIICTPGTNPVGDSFIDREYDGEQETILKKSVQITLTLLHILDTYVCTSASCLLTLTVLLPYAESPLRV